MTAMDTVCCFLFQEGAARDVQVTLNRVKQQKLMNHEINPSLEPKGATDKTKQRSIAKKQRALRGERSRVT